MKLLIRRLFIGFVFLWQISHAGFVIGETAADYYPLVDGNTWTYRVIGPLGAHQETETVLPGATLINGIPTKEIKNTGDPDGDVYEYMTNDAQGIRMHMEYSPASDIPPLWVYYEPPLIVAEATMNIGQVVNSNGVAKVIIEGYGTYYLNYVSTVLVEGTETVVAPAGSYETIKLSYSDRVYGYLLGEWFDYRSTEEDWIAKYIGPVKGILNDSDGIETYELVSTNITPPPAKSKPPFLPFLLLLLD